MDTFKYIKNIFHEQGVEHYIVVVQEVFKKIFSHKFGEEKTSVCQKSEYDIIFAFEGKYHRFVIDGDLESLKELLAITKKLPEDSKSQSLLSKQLERASCDLPSHNGPIGTYIYAVNSLLSEMYPSSNYVIEAQNTIIHFLSKSCINRGFLSKTSCIFTDSDQSKQIYVCQNYGDNSIFKKIDLPFLAFNTNSQSFKKVIRNQCVLIERKALADIIYRIADSFQIDRVTNGGSVFDLNDYGKNICNSELSIISLPFLTLPFDVKGNLILKKTIVNHGSLIDFFASDIYSFTKLKSSIGTNEPLYGRLFLQFKLMKDTYPKDIVEIHSFVADRFSFDKNCLCGTVLCSEKGKTFSANIQIRIRKFLNSISSIDCNYQWHKNCYVTDVVCEI